MRELFPLLLNKLLLRFVPEILPIVSNPVRVSELIVAFLVLLVEPFLVVYSIKRSRRSSLCALLYSFLHVISILFLRIKKVESKLDGVLPRRGRWWWFLACRRERWVARRRRFVFSSVVVGDHGWFER